MKTIPARTVALYRLIVRPMAADPLRALLTVAAVALGVAVIVAVDLASEASMGSFRSSLESLEGSASYEITQVGGIPETVYGELARLAEPLAFSPRIEGFALLPETGERVPLFGVDLVGDTTLFEMGLGALGAMPQPDFSAPVDVSAVWVSPSLGVSAGDALTLIAGDRRLALEVQGVLEPPEAAAGGFVLMDVALAQRALGRMGRLDRIYVHTRGEERGRTRGGERDWPAVLAPLLPPAASILPAGTGTGDSRRMLGAFRWNLRMMSYAAILVGAFLIYNTISAYIVRRRRQIGIVRAVGASRAMVRAAFLFEGAVFGVLGVTAGLVLGRLLAIGTVETVGQTVSSLYVSSTPGEIALRPWTIAVAVVSGIGVSVLSAWWPAREAAGVAPTEAMAGAALDYEVRTAGRRSTIAAAVLAVLTAAFCLVPPVDRIPVGGYLALVCLIGATAMISPRVSLLVLGLCGRWLTAPFGVVGVVAGIAARGLAASLGRTSVIVSAMAVATALIVGMAVMVGSFRETVVNWIEHRLQADFYVSPAGGGGRGSSATMSEAVAQKLEAVPGVMDVGRFRAYPIRYRDTPATLGLADVALYDRHSGIRFLEGPAPEAIWARLAAGDGVIVSELFGYHHDVHVDDTIRLPLGAEEVELRVAGGVLRLLGGEGIRHRGSERAARVPARPAGVQPGCLSRAGRRLRGEPPGAGAGRLRSGGGGDPGPRAPGAVHRDLRPHLRDHLRPGGDRGAGGGSRHGGGAAEPGVRPPGGACAASYARGVDAPDPRPDPGAGRADRSGRMRAGTGGRRRVVAGEPARDPPAVLRLERAAPLARPLAGRGPGPDPGRERGVGPVSGPRRSAAGSGRGPERRVTPEENGARGE